MSDKQKGVYGSISVANHWVTAVIFIGMLVFGFYLGYGGLEREARAPLMGWHKSIGTLFLVFVFWRIGWRLAQGFPKEVGLFPVWQRIAAKATHWLLLLSILIMPLSGVLMSIFRGRSVEVFGWFTIPPVTEDRTVIGNIAHDVHGIAPFAISLLIVLHIAAAVKHHVIDKDVTLLRMLGRDVKAR